MAAGSTANGTPTAPGTCHALFQPRSDMTLLRPSPPLQATQWGAALGSGSVPGSGDAHTLRMAEVGGAVRALAASGQQGKALYIAGHPLSTQDPVLAVYGVDPVLGTPVVHATNYSSSPYPPAMLLMPVSGDYAATSQPRANFTRSLDSGGHVVDTYTPGAAAVRWMGGVVAGLNTLSVPPATPTA